MNPELLRNLWLELTPVRRWGVPFTVAMVLVIVGLVTGLAGPLVMAKAFAGAGLAIFGLFSIWGATKALNSVTSEILNHTWDLQRLAGHRPWDLLVGKLFGSTAGEWYGALMGLAVYALARAVYAPIWMLGLELVTVVGGALLLQALSVFGSLAAANTVRAMRRPNRALGNPAAGLVLALVLGSFCMPFLDVLVEAPKAVMALVPWWIPVPLPLFVPLSVVTFCGWAMAGAHRLIRAELQEPVRPWPWLAFLGFLTLYLYPLLANGILEGNLPGSALALFACLGAGVFGVFVPALMLSERLDVVRLRSLAAAWRRGDRAAVVTQLPLWSFTLAGYVAFVALMGVCTLLAPSAGMLVLVGIALGVLLMLLRDIGMVTAVSLSPRPQRDPGMVMAFMMAILYAILPGLVIAAPEALHPLLLFFFPFAAVLPGAEGFLGLGMGALAAGVPLAGATWMAAKPRIQLALREPAD